MSRSAAAPNGIKWKGECDRNATADDAERPPERARRRWKYARNFGRELGGNSYGVRLFKVGMVATLSDEQS